MILAIGVLLLGCSQSRWQPPDEHLKVLPTRVQDTSDAAVVQKMTDLSRNGIKVVTMGQDYLVSIPMTMLFPEQSPRLTWAAYEPLNEVVAFLQQFRKIAVNVTAYGTHHRSPTRERSLTTARAAAVSNYLWSQGVDTRIVFATGAGATKPIASCGPQEGEASPNARVEITFRNAIA